MCADSQHLKIVKFLFIALVIVALLPKAFASPNYLINQIDKIRKIYSHSTESVHNKNAKRTIIYSESGKDGYEIKQWRLADEKNNYIKGAHEVRIFIENRSIVKTRHVIQSLSGDWAYLTEYFYYTNGNIAFIYEANVTYNGYILKEGKKISPDGPFVVEKRSYYSEDGERIRYLKKSFLEKSGKAIPNTQIQDISPVKFGSIPELPFFNLIQSKLKKYNSGK